MIQDLLSDDQNTDAQLTKTLVLIVMQKCVEAENDNDWCVHYMMESPGLKDKPYRLHKWETCCLFLDLFLV